MEYISGNIYVFIRSTSASTHVQSMLPSPTIRQYHHYIHHPELFWPSARITRKFKCLDFPCIIQCQNLVMCTWLYGCIKHTWSDIEVLRLFKDRYAWNNKQIVLHFINLISLDCYTLLTCFWNLHTRNCI